MPDTRIPQPYEISERVRELTATLHEALTELIESGDAHRQTAAVLARADLTLARVALTDVAQAAVAVISNWPTSTRI